MNIKENAKKKQRKTYRSENKRDMSYSTPSSTHPPILYTLIKHKIYKKGIYESNFS